MFSFFTRTFRCCYFLLESPIGKSNILFFLAFYAFKLVYSFFQKVLLLFSIFKNIQSVSGIFYYLSCHFSFLSSPFWVCPCCAACDCGYYLVFITDSCPFGCWLGCFFVIVFFALICQGVFFFPMVKCSLGFIHAFMFLWFNPRPVAPAVQVRVPLGPGSFYQRR